MNARALIGPMKRGGAQGIAALLAAAHGAEVARFETDRVASWAAVMRAIERSRYRLLIADFADEDAPPLARLFTRDAALAVIDFNSTERVIHVHCQDIGGHQFIALAHQLAGLDRFADYRCEWQPKIAGMVVAEEAQAKEAPLDLDGFGKWLVLRFAVAVARSTDSGGAAAIPGWSLSREGTLSALDPGFAELSHEELAGRLAACEAALFDAEGEADNPCRLLEKRFGLSRTEARWVTDVLGPDLDPRLARAAGYLNDDLTQQRITPAGLALLADGDTSPPDLLAALLDPERPIARQGLLIFDRVAAAQVPLSRAALRVSDDLVARLLGLPFEAPGIEVFRNGHTAATNDAHYAEFDVAAWTEKDEPVVVIAQRCEGEPEAIVAMVLCTGRAVVRCDLAQLPSPTSEEMRNALLTARRLACLEAAALLVTGLDALPAEARARATAWLARQSEGALDPPLVVESATLDLLEFGSRFGRIIELRRLPTTVAGQAERWLRRCTAAGTELPAGTARELAASYGYTPALVDTVLAVAMGDRADGKPADAEALASAARRVSGHRVPGAARRVEARFCWDDIILPEPAKKELRQIAGQLLDGGTVLDTWNFRRRLAGAEGTAVLFAGPSGTGKTMAAQVIANETGAPLFQVDLARTVSKYIGETSKILDEIFEASDTAHAILLFDEADALFGRRSEVKDAHDRYANIEVAHLLQCLERYRGLAILTTNFKQNFDSAFLRRLRFSVDFEMPGEAQRKAIWVGAFPEEAPLAKDVRLDLFAQYLPLSGGSIEKIAVNAAFIAAAAESEICAEHIVAAARRELAKLGIESAGAGLMHVVGAPAERAA